MNRDSSKPGRGLGIANTIVWGAITLMMGGAAAFSAAAAFNSAAHRSPKEAVITAGMAIVSTAIAAATGHMTKHVARDAFGKVNEKKQDLPPFFARLFANEKGDSPNPPSRTNPDGLGAAPL